jgi:hypothetical protein
LKKEIIDIHAIARGFAHHGHFAGQRVGAAHAVDLVGIG